MVSGVARVRFFGLSRFALHEIRVKIIFFFGCLLFFLSSFILVVKCDGGRGFALQAVIAPRSGAFIEDEAVVETKKSETQGTRNTNKEFE